MRMACDPRDSNSQAFIQRSQFLSPWPVTFGLDSTGSSCDPYTYTAMSSAELQPACTQGRPHAPPSSWAVGQMTDICFAVHRAILCMYLHLW